MGTLLLGPTDRMFQLADVTIRGDQIGWFFANWATFGGSLWFFERMKEPKNNGDFLGYFLFKQIYYIFTKISSFKTWFVVGILRFQKWFDVDVLDFQIEFCHINFSLFLDLATFWGYSLKNLANFFLILWSPCYHYCIGQTPFGQLTFGQMS